MITKTKTAIVAALFVCIMAGGLYGQTRTFSELFPDMDDESRAAVFSRGGQTITQERSIALRLLSPALADLDLESEIRTRNPVVLVESLLVVPRGARPVTLLDIYNALGNVRDLKGREYHSYTKNRNVPLFEDATRISDPRRREAVPDPAPASVLPARDTVYMNLRDNNFGACYYRADFSAHGQGALYSLANFRTIYYIVVPVIREDKFFAHFYIEPIAEGTLVYCLAGADVSDFVAGKVDMPSAIEKRALVIQGWVAAGLNAAR